MKTFIAAGLLALLALPAQSLENVVNLDVFDRVHVFYSPGFALIDSGPLQQALSIAGYPQYSPTVLTQGAGVLLNFNRVLVGGAGYGVSGFRTATAEGDTLQLDGRYGLFHLGYELWRQQGLHVYPLLGLGSGSISVLGSKPLGTLFGFQNAADATRMDSNHIIVDLGVGADYLVDFSAHPSWAVGLSLGLKTGYLFVPSPPQWEANRQVIGGNLPNLNVGGPYLNLSIGFGAGRKLHQANSSQWNE